MVNPVSPPHLPQFYFIYLFLDVNNIFNFLIELKAGLSPNNLDGKCPFPWSFLSIDKYAHQKASLWSTANFINVSVPQFRSL